MAVPELNSVGQGVAGSLQPLEPPPNPSIHPSIQVPSYQPVHQEPNSQHRMMFQKYTERSKSVLHDNERILRAAPVDLAALAANGNGIPSL